MAALVPGLPANLGTFEVSCTLALRAFGVAPAAALSFALVYHALHTIPVTVLGLALQRRSLRRQIASSTPPEPAGAYAPSTSTSTTSGR
jgi:uncharacterized membrane protein YbhN (UPF0104 family)